MTLSEARQRCRDSAWVSSLLALFLVALAWGVRTAAGSALQNFPYMLFFPAIAIATYMGDRRAGLIASTASIAVVMPSFRSHAAANFPTPSDLVSIPVFLVVAGIVVEVTAMLNRSSDAALRMAEENRILFMELKHRTANDLQMVASLLALHQTEATDEPSQRLIGDAIRRLRLLGDLHRQMYEPGSVSLDIRRFLTRLCADLGASLGQNPISCEILADYVIASEASVPLTMIVHELISNAIEHGAGVSSDGQVTVVFDDAPNGGHVLTVADDGPGLPPGFDPKASTRLGMKLVRAFGAQLGATIEWSQRPHGGTLVALNFPPAAALTAPQRPAPRAGKSPGLL